MANVDSEVRSELNVQVCRVLLDVRIAREERVRRHILDPLVPFAHRLEGNGVGEVQARSSLPSLDVCGIANDAESAPVARCDILVFDLPIAAPQTELVAREACL